jgi:hypothetical protein
MIKKLTIFLIPILVIMFFGFKPKDKPNGNQPYQMAQNNPNQILITDQLRLDANQIRTWFRNNGSFNRDPVTGNAGFEWPKGAGDAYKIRYASGLWLGAKINGELRIAVAEYDYEYLSGYIDDNGNPQGKDDPNYRVYNIYSNGDGDWDSWPVDQGAYVDSLGNPFLLGAQTQFYVYTDGYPESHSNNAGSTAPLKAQILQTNWCYAVNGPLSNMAFSEFKVINRGNEAWDSCYLAMWTDDDIGANANNDATGCDIGLDLGFTYSYESSSPPYGSTPPAVGFDFFRGPIIPSPGDTVRYFNPPGSNNLIEKIGYRELGLTAFNAYYNGDPNFGDPRSSDQTWNALRGFITQSGLPHVNPTTGLPTPYVFSGNPATGSGWNMTEGRDVRFLQCSGPITMNPGDTQTIIIGQIVGRGTNNLTSINSLKQSDALAQRIFDNNFQVPDAAPCPFDVSVYAPGNGKIYISWGDSSEKIIIPNKLSTGTYRFQGYNVYQIRPGTTGSTEDERELIATFDIQDGITDIEDSIYVERYGTYVYTVVQPGFDNGISRYIVIDRDVLNNDFLINGTEYYFAVTAYYYDPLGGPFSAPKVNESPVPNCVISIIPQGLTLGTQVHYGVGDTIRTSQRDIAVYPIIVRPLEMKTAFYSYIKQGSGSDMTWRLDRTIGGSTETLVQSNDFTGLQDTAVVVDGMLIVSNQVGDSGVIKDVTDPLSETRNLLTWEGGWSYNPPQNRWLRGASVTGAKLFTGRQFQSREIGISFPHTGSFRGLASRIRANSSFFQPGSGTNTSLQGGPLRNIKIVFGQNSMAYRYSAGVNLLETDTNLTISTPFADMVEVPFSVFAVDDLDSSGGEPRQLSVGFIDTDNNGLWDPDTTAFGKYQVTYIMASSYSLNSPNYTTRNPANASPALGFPSMDIMYAWVPRVRNVGGAPMTFTPGDELFIYPYRPNRGDFVPGYPIHYDWNTQGPDIGNTTFASRDMEKIKVFPNPYYGGSRLESDPFDRFVYFSNLPSRATIYIYTLDGVLVRKIDRLNNDPNNSLEKWDLQNADQISVASGMYLIYIDSPGIGTRVLKLAVFTPQERLNIY